MSRLSTETLSTATIIEDCGPLALFALRQPGTICALRQIRWLWPKLEEILFAFTHMFDVLVPKACIAECLSVWITFEHKCGKDVDVFVAQTLNVPLSLTRLALHSRVALKTAITKYLKSYVQDDAQIRDEHYATTTGVLCPEIGCVCVLIGQADHKLDQIPIAKLQDLWATKTKLLTCDNNKCGRQDQEYEHHDDDAWDNNEPLSPTSPFELPLGSNCNNEEPPPPIPARGWDLRSESDGEHQDNDGWNPYDRQTPTSPPESDNCDMQQTQTEETHIFI